MSKLAPVAALALAAAWFGYSRAAKASLPPAPSTGVDSIDGELFGSVALPHVATEADTLARTVWAEARGEGYIGMQAVANVIMNRLQASLRTPGGMWWGNTVEAICLAPKQFSAWNAGDPNRAAALNVTPADLQFRQAQEIAIKALSGTLDDLTHGATHYHTVGILPSWADSSKRTASIGNHVFYA